MKKTRRAGRNVSIELNDDLGVEISVPLGKTFYDNPVIPLPSYETIKIGDIIIGFRGSLKSVANTFENYFHYFFNGKKESGISPRTVAYATLEQQNKYKPVLFMRHTRHHTLEIVAATPSFQSEYIELCISDVADQVKRRVW